MVAVMISYRYVSGGRLPSQRWHVGLTHFLASSSSLSLILALKHNAVPYWLDLHLMHVPLPLSFSAQGLACTAWGQNGQRKWTLREVGYKIFV